MKQLSDDWNLLGVNYYRRITLYKLSLGESLNFDNFFIAIGGRGGLIAFLERPKQSGKCLLLITTASGQRPSETHWKDSAPIAVTWSDCDELVVVQKSGYATMLNCNGTFNRRISFGKDAENSQIIDAKFFTYEGHTAVACVTGSSQIFISTSLDRPRILAVSTEVPLFNRAFVWRVISSTGIDDSGAFKGAWVLLAVDKEVYHLGTGKAMKVDAPMHRFQRGFSAFHKLAVSPDETMVAFYLDSSVLAVTSLDMSTIHLEMDFSDRAATFNAQNFAALPVAIEWLDDGTVGLQWKNFVVIVDLNKNAHEFFYPSHLRIQPEVDGLRVLTPTSHELIQRVPSDLESVGRIGASSPAFLLLSAHREWTEGSGRAHDFLRHLQTSPERMFEAVSSCLTASGHCASASVSDQKALLGASQFGRGFLSVMQAAPAVAACVDSQKLEGLSQRTIQVIQTLRLINSLAVDWVGMALTWRQFESLGPLTLLDRLLARKHYPLAMELVRVYQNMPIDTAECAQVKASGLTRILCHWVKGLPAAAPSPHQPQPIAPPSLLSRFGQIIDRCTAISSFSISFAEVATIAIQGGHIALAEQCLNLEPRVSAQIPLLMRLKKYSLALSRVVESGDTDLLLFGVLQPLQEDVKMEPTALSMLLRQHPIALALYREYLGWEEGLAGGSRQRGRRNVGGRTLAAALQQEDNPVMTVRREVVSAFAATDPALRSSALIKAKDSYHQMKCVFLAQACEDAAKLINFHKRLEQQRITAPFFRLGAASPSTTTTTTPSSPPAPPRLVLPLVLQAAAFRWQGSSVNATYTRLVAAGSQLSDRMADQMRREFRMPERRVAYLRLIGLALCSSNANAAWIEIERTAFAKRPPVPLDVIVKVYLDAGRHQQAVDVIAKLPIEQKIRALILVGKTSDAINLATQERSERLLYLIQRLLHKTDRETADQVGRIRSQLA